MKIIFLSYINRSGSTYFANLLGQHEMICAVPEAEVLIKHLVFKPDYLIQPHDIKFLNRRLINNPKLSTWGLRNEVLRSKIKNHEGKEAFSLFLSIIDTYIDIHCSIAEYVIFKGTELLDVFLKNSVYFLSRGVTFISIIRDGRAVYASQKVSKGSITGMIMSDNPVETALKWKRFVNTLTKSACIYIQYEDLLQKQNTILKEVFESLEINQNILYNNQRSTNGIQIPDAQKHLHENVNKPPDLNRINSWMTELEEKEICQFEIIAAKELQELGYALTGHRNIYNYVSILHLYLSYLRKKVIPKWSANIKNRTKQILFRSPYA